MARCSYPRVSAERRHVAAAARAGTGRWRLIAPDLRGFGPAAVPETADQPPPTMDDFAADVALLLDRLQVDRATIGGLSMGGYVTFALFRKYPLRFTGMILADTKSPADTPEGREARRAMIELVRASGPSAVADQMLPKLLGARSTRTRPDLVSPGAQDDRVHARLGDRRCN